MQSTDLHGYARMNRIRELSGAIMHGANLNEKDEFGATALHYAIAEKSLETITLLLEHNADVTAQDNQGKTPLHYAVEHRLPAIAEVLIKKNPTVIVIPDKFGNEPLWTAAFNARGDYELVSLLLQHGADPKHRNNANLSPMDIPKRKRDDGLLKLLVKD